MQIDRLVERHAPRARELRHAFHQVPELMYEEIETARMIRDELERIGVESINGVDGAPTATVASVGPKNRPTVALRADIDALPIEEKTGLPYASKTPGRMHACGHDGHIATLLGTAAALKEHEKDLPVNVSLIFQPAEEGGGGAKKLMDAGLADGKLYARPEAIFGLHGWPGLPTGTVSSRPGPLLAATDQFTITIHGSGTHGAFPHLGRDPVVAAAEVIGSLQQIASRDFDPTEPVVVTVGSVHGGTAPNVIPSTVTLRGTARTLTDHARKLVHASLKRRSESAAAACGCRAEFEWHAGYPPTTNDAAAFNFVARQAKAALGNAGFVPAARPAMGGEDFAYYLERIPGCFFLVGLQDSDAEPHPPLHSDRFDFTDRAIGTGMTMFLKLVEQFPAYNRASP